MADAESRINLNIDATQAMATIKSLQSQISAFHQQLRATGDAASRLTSTNNAKNLVNSINATKQFSASFQNVSSAANTFTNALERNKLSMGEYFKYGVAASSKFGKAFRSEWSTIDQVARERVKTLQTQFIRLGKDANGAIETIRIKPLRLDLKNLETQVLMNNQKQQIFNQLLKQGSTQLLNFGKNTQWAGRQLMVGFTIPLSILGGTAIKSFQEMEEAVIKFKRVYGELNTSVAETDEMIKNIEQLAKSFTKYGVAIRDTMELAAEAAAMGKMGADLTAQVAEATKLAVLGGVEQSEALKTTISIQNALGVSTADLASKIDFLNAVENQTVVSIEDLTVAIPKAGPVVRQLGGDVEDLAFFLTAMKEGGINASEGANALKSGLASLINPTKQSTEMLASFGININSIVEGNAGDIKGTVIGFAQALDTLDPLNRARAIEQLFGKFQFSRISTLFQNIVTEGTQASRVLDLTRASAAELAILSERELKRVEDSPAFKFQKALEDIKKELVPLGLEFIKLITPIIEFAKGMLEQFNNMDSGVKTFVTGLIAVLGLIAPVALMTFGLFANGIANLIKGFGLINTMFGKIAGVSSNAAGAMGYFTQEQLEAAAVASSLNQVHSNLTQTFSLEKGAVDALTLSYRNAASAMRQYNVAAMPRVRPGGPAATSSGSGGTGAGSPGSVTKPPGFKDGVLSLPGPKGAGDIIPAMLAPGEAVIPAKKAQKYRGFIQQMIAGKLPEFAKGFLGMPKSAKSVTKNRQAAEGIYQNFLRSKYRNMPPTEYGHQLSPTSGHSFPIFGLGGVYMTPSGKKVFVKPMISEETALAEMRGTQIARQAHGLKAPQQRIVVIRDPQDVTRKRRFLALESDLDPTFMNTDNKAVFNEEQYFRQLVASLVRADKDLAAGNMFGDVVADVGPAGVFSRASGERSYTTDLPSMEDQATVNLLGVKGGAKRAFAESTVGLMAGLTPERYHQKMISEIDRVLPLLRQTIAGFKLTDPTEVDAYNAMISRLQTGRNVDWRKFHAMHSNVQIKTKPSQAAIPKYADGVISVPGPKGAGDVVPAMLSPGEAVIPADKANKYRGFIQQMIAGNIPGFILGEDEVQARVGGLKALGPREGRRGRSAATSYTMIEESGQDAEALFRKLAENGVRGEDAMKLLSAAADKAKEGAEAFSDFIDVLNKKIQDAPKKASGDVKSTEKLLKGVREEAGIKVINQKGTARSHLGSGIQISKEEFEKKVAAGEITPRESELRAIRESDPSKMVNVKSGLYMSGLSRSVNAKMATQKGAPTDMLLESFDTAAPEMFSESIRNGGGNVDELSESAKALTTRMRELIATSDKATFFDTREQAEAFNQKELAAGRAASGGSMEEIYANAMYDLGPEHDGLKETLKTAASRPFDVRLEGGSQVRIGEQGPVMPEMAVQAEKELEVSEEYKQQAIVSGEEVGRNFVVGVKQGADQEGDMNSPSREMFERGKNLVRGMLNGVEEEIRNSTGQSIGGPSSDLPKPPGPPPIPGFEDQVAGPTYVDPDVAKGQGIGKNLVNKAGNALERGITGDNFFTRSKIGGIFKDTLMMNAGYDQIPDIEGETQLDRSKRELEAQRARVAIANSESENLAREMLNISQAQQLADTAAENIEEQGISIYNEDGTQKSRRQIIKEENALQKAKDKAAKAKNKDTRREAAATKRQARAGKALGVLGTATMVAGMASGMDGMVGQIAQTVMPFLAGMSAIAPILLALPLPLALLAAGVGAVAFGLYKWNEMINKAREEGQALGNALSMSTDKLIKFSEATGKVSATEERRRRQQDQLSGTTESQRKFGQTFLESEAGQMLTQGIGTAGKFGVSAEDTADSIARQLSTLVLQGVVDSSEASSIAAALGLELGDQTFSANIVGKLIQIIGPNGKNIEEDPLSVALQIQEESQQNIQDFAQIAFDEDAVSQKIKDKILEERTKAAIDRNIRYAKGGWDGFVSGIEGWAADGFGFLMGGSEGTQEISDIDPQYLFERAQETERLQSATIQLGINQIQQNQQLLDSFNKQYESKKEALEQQLASTTDAEERKKIEEEISEIEKERNSGLKQLNEKNAKSLNDILALRDQFSDDAFNKAISTSFLGQFDEDDPMIEFAKETLNQLENLEDKDLAATIQLGLAGGELDISTVQDLLEIGDDGTYTVNAKFKLIVDKASFSEASQIMQLAGKAGFDTDQSLEIASFITTTDDLDARERQKQALTEIGQLESEYGIGVDYSSVDEAIAAIGFLDTAMQDLEDRPDKIKKDWIIAANVDGRYDELLGEWEDLASSDGTITKTMIFEFLAFAKTSDMDLVDFYLQSTGRPSLSSFNPKLASKIRETELPNAITWLFGQGKNEIGVKNPNPNPGSESGQQQDPYESLLSRLREVRDASIDAASAMKDLNKIVGKNKIRIFDGIENQLVALGAGGSFIDWILGQEEETQKRFMTVSDGIVKLTKEGIAAQRAFNEIAIGEAFLEAQKQVQVTKDQEKAVAMLVRANFSLAEAYEIVADEALAAAIASEQIKEGTEEWEQLTGQIREATEAARLFNAAQSLANASADLANQAGILDWINENIAGLSNEMINEILSNPALQEMILAGPNLSEEQIAVLTEYLENFLNNGGIDLEIKKLTIEGMEEIFNDGFNKAMEAFAAEEKAIELEFEMRLADDNKLVEDAQNQIAAINFEIDDLEAQLVGIEDQEEKINEKYDEKLKALEEIKNANEEIARQAKSQLNIADALSRGDIAAAASAIQEARAQNAQARIDSQEKLLEKAREVELAAIVSASGRTRKQLEEEIKKLKDEIFQIEENTLEPAQERIRLAEIEKQQRIDAITVLGRTRLEWEQIKNGIDLAKTRSDIYRDAMQQALDVVKDIENYWNGLNRTVTTVHDIIQRIIGPGEEEGAGGGTGGGFANDNTAKGKPITYVDLGDGRGQASTEFGPSTPVELGPGREISTGDVEYRALRGESLQDVANRLGVDVSRLRVADMREGNRNGEYLFNNQLVYLSPLTMASGGMVPKYLRMGGMLPYKAEGGSIFKSLGTDTIPAMLSPGEFVVRKFAVDNFGVDRLKAINSGTYSGESVYNYSVNVNVKSGANPDQIARAVMTQIKQIDSQRIRSNRF